MENQQKTNAGQGLGIAGLVLGILAIPLGMIPCTFVAGLVFGAAGIVLGAIGFSQARQGNGSTGLTIAALSVSIVGFCFALIWTVLVMSSKGPMRELGRRLHKIEKNKDYEEDFKTEFKKEFGKDLEGTLDSLEDNLNATGDSISKNLNAMPDEEKARKVGKAAGKALKEFMNEMKDTTKVGK
jgi:hypothetical protein